MHRKTAISIAICSATATGGVALAACAFALPTVAEGNVIEMQLTPAGTFGPSDGRDMDVPAWRIDAAAARQVIARWQSRRTDTVVDYEHQTLHREENGQPAPAAGWVRDLAYRDGVGLFAKVELTERAAAAVAAREYRYVSPVFAYGKDGTVQDLLMAAITNTPALDGMTPLALAAAATFHVNQDTQELSMDLLKTLLAALGLPETTLEKDAVAALNARLTQLKDLRGTLGVAEDADAAAAVAACTALKAGTKTQPDPAKYVPISVVQDLQTNIAALSARQTERDVDDLVTPALADGRLLPGEQEKWARELGKTNIAALSAYLKTAQPIAALTGSQTGGRVPNGGTNEQGLTDAELAVCAATGIAPDVFKKTRDAK